MKSEATTAKITASNTSKKSLNGFLLGFFGIFSAFSAPKTVFSSIKQPPCLGKVKSGSLAATAERIIRVAL